MRKALRTFTARAEEHHEGNIWVLRGPQASCDALPSRGQCIYVKGRQLYAGVNGGYMADSGDYPGGIPGDRGCPTEHRGRRRQTTKATEHRYGDH